MRTSARAISMSLLFSSARRMASFSVSESVSPLITPTRSSEGSGGTGRGCTAGKFGSSTPCSGGVSVCGCSVGETAVGAGLGAVVAGGVVVVGDCVPGGFCGAGCCVLGGVCGFAGGFGRAVGGTVCCCSVPGGRVASVCVGVCVEDCCASAVVTTNGSPIFLKAGLLAVVFVFESCVASPFES